MKKTLLFLSLFVIVTTACDLSVTIAPPTSPASLPTNTTIPATAAPTQPLPTNVATQIPATATPMPPTVAPTAQDPVSNGSVSFGHVSLVLPSGIASSISGNQFPRADAPNLPYWSQTPGHTVITLQGYGVRGKAHEPQIYIYPASDYALLVPSAFESIHRLDNILYGPGGPALNDQLPTVPFFNAQQAFASQVQLVSFQNGQGVRSVTEYAQYAVSANNQELFYHFEGVTRDGAYYIVAIFPITAPVVAETSDGGAALPSGGIPYPYFADPNADMKSYYAAVTDVLDGTSPDAFTPAIGQLDMLIQSIQVNP